MEPPIGIEPMTYALREACCLTAHALPAPIARIIAMTILATLGLSGVPFTSCATREALDPVIRATDRRGLGPVKVCDLR